MSGLLAAQHCAGPPHLFQNVFIAHRCAQHLDAGLAQRDLQSHVRHGGSNHGIVRQIAALLQLAREQKHHRVAVDDVPIAVGKEGAISIAIKADPKIGFAANHFAGHRFRIQRSAILVNVAAVGSGMNDFCLESGALKDFGREWRRRAIGAVHNHFQALGPGNRPAKPLNVGRAQTVLAGK